MAKINKSFTKGYSKISQELFWSIYEKIKNKYKEIYFATNNNGIRNNDENKEFVLLTPTNIRLLDFYIPEIKKCIEFDGDYWHGEKRGNQQRDRIREEEIIKTGIKIFRVKERDYEENSEKVLNECLEFINNG